MVPIHRFKLVHKLQENYLYFQFDFETLNYTKLFGVLQIFNLRKFYIKTISENNKSIIGYLTDTLRIGSAI